MKVSLIRFLETARFHTARLSPDGKTARITRLRPLPHALRLLATPTRLLRELPIIPMAARFSAAEGDTPSAGAVGKEKLPEVVGEDKKAVVPGGDQVSIKAVDAPVVKKEQAGWFHPY